MPQEDRSRKARVVLVPKFCKAHRFCFHHEHPSNYPHPSNFTPALSIRWSACTTSSGLTCLHHAARKGHSALAKELLRYRADLKAQDQWGPDLEGSEVWEVWWVLIRRKTT